ncbi:mpv17-like protein 2 [Branchiostoma floridae]|uniref:Mpv17-like protein 2 n=1 Tax=Branchiostoma floridae TaxID=7739 RepID=A0A9J7NA16_BRAFL|nr:mpv17-like protein 2 [Branchiostoma floridae]XP_035698568.1 mpv17-like protein 2 [Branchiostoma floridae]XP_035698569.1 mpv17-like protein 2 [Branchiostoma floridae]
MFAPWIRTLSKNLFGRYLLVTNVVSSGALLATGDIIQQTIELAGANNGQKRDWRRTGRMCVIGTMMGPFNHFWYKMLDFYLPGTTFYTITRKILCDQIVAAPFFASFFLIGMGSLEGESIETSIADLKKKFWAIYLADWTVWPPAQAINFYFVPSHLRVIYVNCMTLGWDTYLSYIKHRDANGKKAALLEKEDIILSPNVEINGNINKAQ